MTDHIQTYHVKFFTGPLQGKTVRVDAYTPFHAATHVADAIGMDAMNCADWPVYHDTGTLDMFASAPQETITIAEAVRLLNADAR